MKNLIISRLSNIDTSWHVLRQAHESGDSALAAKKLLIERYAPAVQQYLLAGVRDADAADELFQEFSLALVRNDFYRVNPECGRFRDYVKTVLFHLVGRHNRRQSTQPQSLDSNLAAEFCQILHSEGGDADREFVESWRRNLLSRAWDALARTNQIYYQVLKYRAEHPQSTSQEMAADLTSLFSRQFTTTATRQSLHRARELFAILLVEEVARTLKSPTLENLQDELRDLNLHKYCRKILDRRGDGASQ